MIADFCVSPNVTPPRPNAFSQSIVESQTGSCFRHGSVVINGNLISVTDSSDVLKDAAEDQPLCEQSARGKKSKIPD